MSSFQRVLILDHDAGLRDRRSSDLITDTAATISQALDRLATEGYDAVLCRVDKPEEVSFLLRIKKVVPAVPLVALTPGGNPALDDLARDSGADEVQARSSLGAAEVISRSRELRVQGRELVAQRRQLIARRRILSKEWINQVREVFKGFLPLVVEDNPDQVVFLKRAFEKAFLPCPLPVMRDGLEAIHYLQGEAGYGDRATYPLPTLAILDIKMPKKSGLDVIQWIRSRPKFARLPVFMLTASPDHYDTAMTLGANDYYTKPMESGGLREILRTIAVRWWFFQQAFEASPPPR